MNIKLFFETILKFLLVIGLLLFIPANTINYWNGWLFMGIGITIIILGLYMIIGINKLQKID